ncbi:MAG: glycerol-3-phosphate dehydrogenase/oxidase [Myxococcales bacterium]|nr:glycerol-3-phosphate dehydrogenase/oxidase [Myxococcales bacterium]
MTSRHWSLAERVADLARAEREGVELLVIGGGITGAGVLRDAATRGLRALLVEREDFASGTSSRSSKFVHGGLRYIGEGHLAMTRLACRERDRLLRLAPHLVETVPFLFPAYDDSRIPLWQVRSVLWIYAALANFRSTSRFRMLELEEVRHFSPDLRTEGLRGAGLYHDAQVDDARLVLETLRSARSLGCPAVNHAEVVEFLHAPPTTARGGPERPGRIAAVRVRDHLAQRSALIRAEVVVNAAGPAIDRVRGLDGPVRRPELRPAKGIHLVIPGGRVRALGAVTFQAPDGRHVFLAPWGDVALIGTTDTFTSEIDEPVVTIEEVHYLLSAANHAFPSVGLTTNDLRSVFAGVRPLAASAEESTPPSSVSREDRIYRDPSGLLSAVGGKLTTYRATGEKIVDRVVRRLPSERRRKLGPSRTAELPLRVDDFDNNELETALRLRFGVGAIQAAHLVRAYGADAEALLCEAPPELRRPVGRSRYTLAEIPWCIETECPASLCDLLERRVRAVLFATGQGLPDLAAIAEAAAARAGWDEERSRAETLAYAASVRRRYQIVAPERNLSAA